MKAETVDVAQMSERLDQLERRIAILQPLLYRTFYPINGGVALKVVKVDDLKQMLADAGLQLEVHHV